jgi:two-component system, NtrC family, response regulator GlrR
MMHEQPRVLLVDDDRSLLRLLSMRLMAAGYDVLGVESGKQALEQLPRYQPDMMITDLKMDGMDGMELFEKVNRRYPDMPVLILTAHGTIPDAFAAASRGVFSYLTKPYNSKVLLEHMARALRVGNARMAGAAGS